MNQADTRKEKSILALFYCFISIVSSQAEEFYPPPPIVRMEGTDQGICETCATHADINALENSFHIRGFPVRLSLFHALAQYSQDKEYNINMRRMFSDPSQADAELIDSIPTYLPHYMWPEEEEGYDPSALKLRIPSISEMAVIDPNFLEDARSMRVVTKTKHLYSEPSDIIGQLKELVRNKESLVLQVHSRLLGPRGCFNWDHYTGLLNVAYSKDFLLSQIHGDRLDYERKANVLSHTVNHRVALVGFDDRLYSSHGYKLPGAFIIRNSWNSPELRRASEKFLRITENKLSLQSFRWKISKLNPPGYYAIPYQYFLDMASTGSIREAQASNPSRFNSTLSKTSNEAGFFLLGNIDFDQYYYLYKKFKSDYQVRYAPYLCETDLGTNQRITSTELQRNKLASLGVVYHQSQNSGSASPQFQKEYNHALTIESQPRQNFRADENPLFYYATLVKNRKLHIDQLEQFYQGRFNSYYCNFKGPLKNSKFRIWPYYDTYQFAEGERKPWFHSFEFQSAISGFNLAQGSLSILKWHHFFQALFRLDASKVYQ